MTTTNRLDRVITSQGRLMVFNLATTFAIMASFAASVVAMF